MNVEAPVRREAPNGPPGHDPRPVVALPNPGLPGLAIAVIAAIAALLLFLLLNGQRQQRGPDPDRAALATPLAPPPPLAIPPEPAPIPPAIVTIPVEIRPAPAPQPRLAPPPATGPMVMPTAPAPVAPRAPTHATSTLAAPALIFDAGGSASDVGGAPAPQQQRPSALGGAPARPTRIANPATVVPTGTLIRAVLETPIDTSRPGLARALVSKDTRGFNGQRILIPRGSRLIGEYASEVSTGQIKVLVNWIQLARPDGTTIRLDSPAADAMGGAGVPGHVNTFFFERFFNAMLQTALTVGPSLLVSNDADVVVGLPGSTIGAVAGQGGLVGQRSQPKITVKQGIAFNVFVARDLDFSGAPLRK